MIEMINVLFNKRHLTEYAIFGSIAGLTYVITVWCFLSRADFQTPRVLFIGSVFFMFVIMTYAVRLTRRKSENYSTWSMIIAGQMCVATGIIVSVIGSFVLCWFYMKRFVDGTGGQDFFRKSTNAGTSNTLILIFIAAIIANYCAGAFISAMVAYALKPDQTKDETPTIFEEPATPKAL
jgi:hypothetical protein